MFERFTPDTRRVIVYAQEESRQLRHQHIGTEHLLLGLLRDDTATGSALQAVGVTLATARIQIEQSQGRGNKEPHGHIPFTPRAKRVLEESLRQSQRLGQGHIARPHLLRGLLELRDSVGAQTLVLLGVDLDALAIRAEELAVASDPAENSAASGNISAQARSRPTGSVSRRSHYRRGAEPNQDLVAARHDDLLARWEELATAFRHYARHDQDCDPDHGCSCGLQQVLDRLERPAPG